MKTLSTKVSIKDRWSLICLMKFPAGSGGYGWKGYPLLIIVDEAVEIFARMQELRLKERKPQHRDLSHFLPFLYFTSKRFFAHEFFSVVPLQIVLSKVSKNLFKNF